MARIQLPKKALERIQIGQAFAEYDLIRSDPELFVSTPATISALNRENTNCFFVGRRGAGKTAITYEVERRQPRTIHIVPQIFDLIKLPIEHDEFFDTRQRPFKSLMHSMERALLDEVVRVWTDQKLLKFDKAPETIRRERGLIEGCDFDQRVLNLTDEIFEAYSTNNEKLWLRQIKRSGTLREEIQSYGLANPGCDYVLLIDRLDESWDGSSSAVICLMALMHATVRLIAATTCVKPYVFVRENIYDRIRDVDNEFSRLETSVVFLDWQPEKLRELVERRMVKPFNTKPKLGGEAWSYFFEDAEPQAGWNSVIGLCQNRPRDVVMLISFAVDAAVSRGALKIGTEDIDVATTRYSTSRLKDLGDEYAENYPNIGLILELFYGLGTEYTLSAIEDFVQQAIVSQDVSKFCGKWFFDRSTPYQFIGLLFSIGFLGIKRGSRAEYKDSSKDSNAKPAIDSSTSFEIHPTYRQALNLQPRLVVDLKETATRLKSEGLLEELPDSLEIDDYQSALQNVLSRLQELPAGTGHAAEFEELVGEIIRLCFFRSLTNVQPKERDIGGTMIRDWVASNRAASGFWEMVRSKHGATQVVFECKNYADLKSDDFHQVGYYLSETFGQFGVLAHRGNELKAGYFKHISNIANKNNNGVILVLMQKDLEVFLRQSLKGGFKESHIQDRYDYTVRQIS